MAGADRLIEQMRAQRTARVELAPGKVLLVRRPAEATEMLRFRGSFSVETIIGQVVGWEGITEADLLGEAVGAAAPVEWTRERCDEALADRTEWVGKAAEHIAEAITSHIAKRGAAEKN